jgi:amino acid adenylation domain-containing protein
MNTSNTTSYPLSSTQREVWFEQLLHPNVPLYNIGGYLRIDGPIEPTIFEKALNQLIQDNDALRLVLHEGETLPSQTLAENVSLKLDYYDFSTQKNAPQSALEWMKQEFAKPFQLYDRLLFQFALLKISADCYYWLGKYHHLIMDGWSISLNVQRVATAYNALVVGHSHRDKTRYSYLDFLKNDQAYLDSKKFLQHQRYWLEKYQSVPEPLIPRRYAAQFQNQTIPSRLSMLHLQRKRYDQLKAFAQENKVSTFHVILGALYCYFVRTAARDDFVIGLPTLNRRTAAFKQTLGLFASVNPAWFPFGTELSFVELIQAISLELQKDYRHQRFPISEINKQVGLHEQGRRQLFDITLSYEKHDYDTHFNGNRAEAVTFTNGFEQNALAVFIREFHDNKNIRVDFEYSRGAFTENEIELIKVRFEFILTEILRRPSVPLREWQLMPEAEKNQILVEFNNTAADSPGDKTIIDLFEEQADKTPDNIALVFKEQQLSYKQLNQKANQQAHHLQTLGVKPEVLVGICVERSLDMVIGLFGILKAGGAYLPLDPAYPVARLALMLEDAQVSVLLTQSTLIDGLPDTTAQLVCLDTEAEALSRFCSDNPARGLKPENLAYVIYTSGSTGTPKGVMIQHQSLVNFIETAIAEYGVTEHDRILQFASINFDAAAEEIYPCLASGGTLVLRFDELLNSVPVFLQHCRDLELTVLDLPTAFWHQVVAELATTTVMLPDSLRLIIIGGERALPESMRLWQKRIGTNPSLINTYGPTEATVVATIYQLPGGSVPLDKNWQELPIGRAIPHVQTYLLDKYLQLVPIGVPGELHLGGTGLARGYLYRPDLTADKFVPNPFNEGCSRLYKTGDLARYLPNGNLEYLGRIDNQVKIRGFRIELSEIETRLAQHSAVRENVVIVHEPKEGDKRLVAYWVANDEQVIDNTTLRRFITEKLPDYMVPSAFVQIDAIPLMPTGKVDRRALSQLSVNSDQLSKETFVAPRTQVEELLAGIWADVLGAPRVGVYDNFFELGGHSLLATQVMSRIRDTFSVELPLRQLFESPTIAALCEHLLRAQRQEQLPPITPLNRDEALPLSFAQQRLWFLDQLEGKNATYNMFGAVRLEGFLSGAALEQSLQAIVQRHETLRSTFPSVDGKPFVQLSVSRYPLPVINLQPLPNEQQDTERHRLVNEEVVRPFDLSMGPLFRIALLQLSRNSHVLLVTMHHIISDGWSIGIFINELSQLYEAFSQQRPSPLPALSIQYVDFANWQRQWLARERVEKQLNYWKKQLAGAPALLELPTDYPRPPIQTFRGQTQPVEIPAALSRKLKQLSQQTGTTLFMTLLAAFATLLSRYSGKPDIVIGSPIANRTQSQIESLIGFFVNTLLLRINLDGNPHFEELLKQVRQIALDAYAHQDIPFEQLVEELQPERSLTHTPLFQVMFVLQNAPQGMIELPGLTLTTIVPENSIAQFDLTLSMEETAQGLVGTLEYNTELFENATIMRLAGHFQTLLEGIVKNPDHAIQELPLLTATEHQQLRNWNDTTTDYSIDECIHYLFEAQVERTPEAIAVVFENQQLTYRALNTKANQLAHYLQTLGVKPEVLVGICVERSLEMVYGLLGILKAGGAYVPVTPDLPVARLAFMLEDAQVSVLLTQEHLVAQWAEPLQARLSNTRIIYLDTDWKMISRLSAENPSCQIAPSNLAYVIYTSGTTGTPKGVMIQHQSLVNHSQALIEQYQLTSVDKTLQFAALNFDVAAEEIFPTLLSGARLVLRALEIFSSFADFRQFIETNQLTVLNLPAPYWHDWVLDFSQITTPLPESLRLVVVGSDNVLSERLFRWQQQVGPQINWLNAYGLTEVTITATLYKPPLERFDEKSLSSTVPIGRPISNSQTYLLDSYLQPVPIGVPGELYLGGAGLARGYLNCPELTFEKFIPNPFVNLEWDNPNSKLKTLKSARLYKTGDLARYLPNGNLEYLGRIDNQVKIRGFRIELGEIEAVLAQHSFVTENAVIVQQNSKTDKRIVAYLVLLHQGQLIENAELRRFLKERLPDYMIPSAFVTLEALPQTPNGKIDRRALAQLSVSHEHLSTETFVAPRTAEEKLLAGIWADILGTEQIGIHDNFFELGGHSLLATVVMSRIRDSFSIALPLNNLFKYPTIAELTERIEIIRGAIQTLQFPENNTTDNQQEEEEGVL